MKNNNLLFLAIIFYVLPSLAFRPVGHVLLKDEIVKSLPDDNKFKQAMLKYPKIASWGAIGPDLGYNVDLSKTFKPKWKRQIKNSWQLADIAHYHTVGSFVTNLINKAYEKNDDKFFAFVGGWITHIAGDFGSHGIYVKPEAGYYIAYEGGRDLHSELEKIADAYLYSQYSKNYCLSGWQFESEYYWQEFFGVKVDPRNRLEKKENLDSLENMIGGNVEKYFIDVYKNTYELDLVTFDLVKLASTYYRSVGKGLGKYAGFKQFTVEEATDKLLLKNRQNLIDSAFSVGKNYGKTFLNKAVSNNKIFSNSWNLDIGENGEPTYIIRIDAGSKMISRTKNDLYVAFKRTDKESSDIKITTKIGPMKFAFYQKDSYFYAVNMGGALGDLDCWKLENINGIRVSLRPRKGKLFTNIFRIKRIVVYYNGKAVSSQGDINSGKIIKLRKSNPITLKL